VRFYKEFFTRQTQVVVEERLDLPYRQSSIHYDEIHWHPADGEANGDVDHGSHNVDLCLGQRR